MEKIIFFGIASNSFGHLNTVSFALNDTKDKNGYLLIDCGPTIPQQIKKSGLQFLDIENVFISHGHFDHFLGLPYLLVGRHLESIEKKKRNSNFTAPNINIIVDIRLKDIVSTLLAECHSDIKNLAYEINYIDISVGIKDKIILNGFNIKVFEVDHTVQTYGCKIIDDKNKSIAYSSDTLPCDEFINNIIGVDYLIHEGMISNLEIEFSKKTKHSTFENAAEVSQKIRPKITFLIHIRPNYFSKKDELEKELSQKFGGKIIFPMEGEFITI